MKSSHVGMGVVIVDGAFDIDVNILSRYMMWLAESNERTFTYSNDGKLAINQTGFKFTTEGTGLAPGRFVDLDGSRSGRTPDSEFLQMRDYLEDVAYKCLVEYCSYFPDAVTTCWWRPSGHIAYYRDNQRIGPHCDDQIAYE
jgi:hypothetical protein